MNFSVRLCYPVTMKTKLLHLLPMKLFILFWQTWVTPDGAHCIQSMFPLQRSKVTPHSNVSICKSGADIPEPSGPLEATETGACGGLCGVCTRQEIGKSWSWGEDLFYSVQWEGFIQSALLAEKRRLLKGLTCTSVSCILYKEALLWNSKPICVSAMHTFRQRWDLQCQGSWDRTCLENYIRLCISGSWHSAFQSSPLLTECFS